MDISPETLGAIATAVAIPIFWRLIRRIGSLKPESRSTKTFEELTKEYARWEGLAALLIIIFVVTIGFAIWKGLSMLSALRMSYVEPSKYLIPPTSAIWALPAMFLAILLSAIPLHFLFLTLLGRERYAEYTEYGNRKFGVDSWKLLRYMAYIAVPICLVFVILSLDSYMRVTSDTFAVNHFFSFGEVQHSFDQIKDIELVKSFQAPNGDIVRRPYYAIGFTDDTNYELSNFMEELSLVQQREMAEYISRNSGVRISVNDPYP